MEIATLVVTIAALIVQITQAWIDWNRRDPPRKGRHTK